MLHTLHPQTMSRSKIDICACKVAIRFIQFDPKCLDLKSVRLIPILPDYELTSLVAWPQINFGCDPWKDNVSATEFYCIYKQDMNPMQLLPFSEMQLVTQYNFWAAVPKMDYVDPHEATKVNRFCGLQFLACASRKSFPHWGDPLHSKQTVEQQSQWSENRLLLAKGRPCGSLHGDRLLLTWLQGTGILHTTLSGFMGPSSVRRSKKASKNK